MSKIEGLCPCGSYAINPHLYGRDDTDLDLCDVCYWMKRARELEAQNEPLLELAKEHGAEFIEEEQG